MASWASPLPRWSETEGLLREGATLVSCGWAWPWDDEVPRCGVARSEPPPADERAWRVGRSRVVLLRWRPPWLVLVAIE